jgi:hypothetical protein
MRINIPIWVSYSVYPLMLSELVSEVSRYKRVSLGEREAEFLARIGEGANSSYKIYSLLKKIGQPIDYKNVNKRVRRLHELELITETKGESIHSAKFFTLTSQGIFYLLTKWQPISWKWLIEYKNNLILQILLYPYFEEKTIKPFIILFEIGRYLRECCHIIELAIDIIRQHPRVVSLKEKILKQLQVDLESQAKSLAFELVTKKTYLQYQVSQFLPDAGLLVSQPGPFFVRTDKEGVQRDTIDYSLLAKDKKFMALAKSIGKEYEQGFSHLIKSG